MNRILIAVPTMGSIHPMLVSRLLSWGRREDVSFYFTFKVAPVDRARNQIVEHFLKLRVDGHALTHLLMIDSDTVPPADAVDRLLAHDEHIVTGLTPIARINQDTQQWETFDNAFAATEKDDTGKVTKTFIVQRRTGLHEIFRCGGACLLIKREVFEKLDRPFFRFISNDNGTEHVRSEDIDFCDRVRGAGFAIHADSEVCCGHEKSIML